MNLIYARKAKATDIDDIVEIINQAKQFLKASGSSQWQGDYPAGADLEQDINSGVGLVLVVDGKVAGYAAVIEGIEDTYLKIDGAWSDDKHTYATIHRLAISDRYRGMHLMDNFISNIITLELSRNVYNFRVDTSKNNKIVQHIFEKHNFIKRGIIYVTEDPIDNSRLAYELNL
ncbi:ribosomal protein S18 acetylase RimI-like enzyme [Lactobacillus colini]|uniref:Ribosomal protein S18 acetylase RimI-like enzyme n=1 Tax=Lactobacillus colini TaxID=1819254 RepID=A0ABS4MFD4_9LACO|nr:GNAT family N-acetyltransferase [Lactobacillus colini]MBP2058401.1 ribosomal protein S18 acetylase RimI-like enzyme [Lactobacillus colini]